MTKEFEQALRDAFNSGAYYAITKTVGMGRVKADDCDTYIAKLKKEPLTVRFVSNELYS